MKRITTRVVYGLVFLGVALFWLLFLVGVVGAQTVVNPTTLEFTASADHALLVRYEARWYTSGTAAQPFARTDLGLPTPDAAGLVTLDIASTVRPFAPGRDYVARVAAIAPDCTLTPSVVCGEAESEPSNVFALAGAPKAPGKPVIKKR